jgi:hypothetical protein
MALLYKKYLSTSAKDGSDEDSRIEEEAREPQTIQLIATTVEGQVGPPVLPGLPLNPHDPFYLTTCFVCGEKAKLGLEHIRNYGGVACFR